MELKIDQEISNQINSTLSTIPKYNQSNFVEDSIQINNILNSELRNISNFKTSINILRAILRDNKTLFCPLFQNIIYKYLLILEKENLVPEEYIFLLVDILHHKSDIKKYYNKWIYQIQISLMKFSWNHLEQKNEGQIDKISKYVSFWFDEYININPDNINSFANFFNNYTDVNLQKISAFFFFKYVYLYDINKITIIDWKHFFNACEALLENSLSEEENKSVIKDIFKQIFIYFQKLNVDPNDVLIKSGSLNAAKYFEQYTGYNTNKAKEYLRSQEI